MSRKIRNYTCLRNLLSSIDLIKDEEMLIIWKSKRTQLSLVS
jgi:hypothetical protein